MVGAAKYSRGAGHKCPQLRLPFALQLPAAFPLVDNKLVTKQLAAAAGLPVPELYGVIGSHREVRNLPQILVGHRDFVLKPAQGSGGDGILVISARVNEPQVYRLLDGRILGRPTSLITCPTSSAVSTVLVGTKTWR